MLSQLQLKKFQSVYCYNCNMSSIQKRLDVAKHCMAEMASQALAEDAQPERVSAMLDKRQSVGRRNIGRLFCEVHGCEAICTNLVRDGKVEMHRPIGELTNLLGNCVYWNTPESEF